MGAQLHTPYRFVPLSKWIYMPDWSHLASHDVPFEDGLSGVIRYTLSNSTPLIVGAEQQSQDDGLTLVKWARDPQGNPVIPGSSLKGMIRNVLEIASFGKFKNVDDNHFSFRDISSAKSDYSQIIRDNKVVSAWLRYDDAQRVWTLQPCDHAKIRHSDINSAYSTKIKNKQSAVEKFKQFPIVKNIHCDFELRKQKQGDRWWAKDLKIGQSSAHLVFTNERIKGPGKEENYDFSYAFYFSKPENKPKAYKGKDVDQLALKMFDSHEENQVKYLKDNQNPDLGIPVFALLSKKTGKPAALGLAKMPRILYENAVSDLADKQQSKARTSDHIFDLPELMLGTLRDNGMSLKSRVFFSDALLKKNKGLAYSGNVTLNNPKATFSNAYLEQKNDGKTDSYQSSSVRLSGWKRYPAQSQFRENINESDNQKVQSQLELLKEQSGFEGKITFHNLKPQELGALLWCLQLGSDEHIHQRFHSLGHAKSLGAGAVQIKPTIELLRANNPDNTDTQQQEISAVIQCFEQEMQLAYNGKNSSDWLNSSQIKHLLAISDPSNHDEETLTYMSLRDFQPVKKNHEKMPDVSLNGEVITREESAAPATCDSKVFGLGRLSALCTDDDKNDNWHRTRQSFRDDYQRKLEQEKEAEKLEEVKAAREAALKDLSDCMRKARELEIALDSASSEQEKADLIRMIGETLDYFISNDCDPDAAELTASLISRSDFLKNKNKKKVGPRKEKLAKFKEKYDLD